MVWLHEELTRRQMMRAGAAGGLALTAGGTLAGCLGGDDDDGGGAQSGSETQSADFRRGGTLRVGATGGGAEDTIDAHTPTSDPDIMRVWQLYEPLAVRNAAFTELEMVLAESLEAKKPDLWTVRLKE